MITAPVFKFGHYQVGDSILFSKQQAMEQHMKTGAQMQYIFNDDVYSRLDWTQEPYPDISLWEMYRQRAQQLRDSYDYLVLQFSGGPDSHNILEVFAKNNIKLDEIVNFNSYDKTQQVQQTGNNADFVYNFTPMVKETLKNPTFAQTQISVLDEIDLTKKIWQHYDQHNLYFDLMFGGSWCADGWIFKGAWIKHVKHIWDRVLAGQRVGVIMGQDKCNLRIHNNRFYTHFHDQNGPDTALLMMHDADFQDINVLEWFYHTPDMPELAVKLAHTLKKTVVEAQGNDFESVVVGPDSDYKPSYYCNSKQYPGNLRYDRYHKSVYPYWAPRIITPKVVYAGTKKNDNFWAAQMNHDDNKMWRHGLVYMSKKFNHCIAKKENSFELGILPLVFSKKYYLE